MAEPVQLAPVYLINGSDRPKIELAVSRLRRHFAPEAVELVIAQETSGAEVAALCNAGSLFGDHRLVVVDCVDGRRNADDRLVNGWKASDVEAIAAYLASPAPGTTLALLAQELKKDAPLVKACTRAGELLEYSHAKRNVAGWVAERFRSQGVRADTSACVALVQLVGEKDLRALASEVDKLVTWAAGEPIGEQEVERLVASVAEAPTFTLTDAWAQRDTARALEATEAIFEREGKPRRDTAPRLAGALGSHLGRMARLKRLAAAGVPPREAAAKLKMHPFYGEKVYRQAEGFSADELCDATVRLAELDLALKGGSRLAPDLEVQRALIELSRAPR